MTTCGRATCSASGRVGLLLGTIVALLSFVPVWLFVGRLLAATVSVTLIAICTLAALVGSTMPLLARIVGVDPAVVSAPFVTTIVDATGLLAYFPDRTRHSRHLTRQPQQPFSDEAILESFWRSIGSVPRDCPRRPGSAGARRPLRHGPDRVP